jgi:hypothetical protein
MRRITFYVVACLSAALSPLLFAQTNLQSRELPSSFSEWPTSFEGRALTALPLSEREQRFSRDFPGQTARYTDGQREIIIRRITEATRKLHPASDCFEGIGYRVHPLPLRVDKTGARWGSFMATRGAERLRVYERIYADDGGSSWSDVSAWYWSAAIGGKTSAPWWSVVIAEKESETRAD